MSTLRANAIQDFNGGNTATINSYTPTESNMMGKNRIINGDMRIDQRNAGASQSVSASTYPFTVDRFWIACGGSSAAFTVQQNQGSVTPPTGFSNYVGITVATAKSPASGDEFTYEQPIEGNNVADLAFGTAGAKTVTASFWVRSSLTGTFSGYLLNSARNRNYVFNYTISSANTWEYKTVTIAGDTTGTWLTTTATGFRFGFDLGSGSNYNATVNTWGATSARRTSGSVQLINNAAATWFLTGVQLEVGSVATPFERLDYGRQLIQCQRYYQKVEAVATHAGRTSGTTEVILSLPLLVALRASPTLSDGGVTYLYSGGARVNSSGGTLTVNSYDTETTSISAVRSGFTGLTDDRIANVNFTSNVTISAEL